MSVTTGRRRVIVCSACNNSTGGQRDPTKINRVTHNGTLLMPFLRKASSISSILSDRPVSPDEDGKNSFSDCTAMIGPSGYLRSAENRTILSRQEGKYLIGCSKFCSGFNIRCPRICEARLVGSGFCRYIGEPSGKSTTG